jgi:hypothetical protein
MARGKSTSKTRSSRTRLSATTKERLSQAHEHLVAATGILTELHGELGGAEETPPVELMNAQGNERTGTSYWYSGGRWFKCEYDPINNNRHCKIVDESEVPENHR